MKARALPFQIVIRIFVAVAWLATFQDGGATQPITVSLTSGATYTGSHQPAGKAIGVLLRDHYAYVACRQFGIVIFDVTDIANPRAIGFFPTPSQLANDIELQDNILYVSDGFTGLLMVDVSRPGNPTLAGSYTNVIYASTAVIGGSRAYLVDDKNNGVQAIDISSPSNPTHLWNYRSGYTQSALALQDNVLTILDAKPSFTFIDVTVPRVINGQSVPTVSSGNKIQIRNGVLFAVQGGFGFRMYDYSNLSTLPLLGVNDGGGNAVSFALGENTAFVGSETEAFTRLDISDLTNPQYVTSYPITLSYGTALRDSNVFVADANAGLVIFDASVPRPLSVVAKYDPSVSPPPRVFTAVALSDIYSAAVETNWFNLFTARGTIYRLGGCPLPGTPRHIALGTNAAFVACGSAGLQAIDLQNPVEPVIRGTLRASGEINLANVNGNTVFAADSLDGIIAIDVTDLRQPKKLGSFPLSGATDLYCNDALAIVSRGAAGISILDISDPTAIRQLSTLDTIGTAKASVLRGQYLYVANGQAGMAVVSLADPSHPTIAATRDTIGDSSAITLLGNVAVLADGTNGIQFVDVASPTAPTLISSTKPYPVVTTFANVGTSLLMPGPSGMRFNTMRSSARIVITSPTNGAPTSSAIPLAIRWRPDGVTNTVSKWNVHLLNNSTLVSDLAVSAAQSADGEWQIDWLPDSTIAPGCSYAIEIDEPISRATAVSSSFCIQTAVPTLRVSGATNQIVISWPAAFAGWSLLSTPSLTQAWTAAGDPILSTQDGYSVEIPISSSTRFFKLSH